MQEKKKKFPAARSELCVHTDSAMKSMVSNVIRPCFFFWGKKKRKGGCGEEGESARLFLEFCTETLLRTWATAVGRKPWETSYQLGLSCPPPLKSPSSTQDLGPALTMYYYGGIERRG